MNRLSFSRLAGFVRPTGGFAACAATLCMVTAMLVPQPASAQWVSTGELVDSYCAKDKPEEAAFCAGYVAGALHVLMAPPDLMPTGRFCIDVDKQPKLSAIADRLVELRGEREELEKTPAFTVIAAIIERGFPCPDALREATTVPPAAPAPEAEPEVPSDLFGLPSSE